MAVKVTRVKHRMRIQKLYNQLIRDNWGNMVSCSWNDWMVEEIEKSKKLIHK